jgi:hypothetical protein
VLHDATPCEDLIEVRQCSPAADHKVFRDDFKPVDHRLLVKDVLIMRDSEADPDPVVGMRIESIGRHRKKAKSGELISPRFRTRTNEIRNLSSSLNVSGGAA